MVITTAVISGDEGKEFPVSNFIAGIEGNSEPMIQLKRYVPLVARSEAPVLITGETGTGKERIAEAVHQLSPRRNAPFIPVNCAALPDTLIESELFGHERGSFTGAITSHAGKTSQADEGSLFLDEIGEMNLYGQAKLLRFLETGVVDRIGSSRPVFVDVRVVAATNHDLEELVMERQFRSDLYYRLNVARIEVEPLRARPGDIKILVDFFLEHFNRVYGLTVGSPDSDLLERLEVYDWPGNVRELRNMVEAAYIDPPRGRLRLRHLSPAFRRLFEGHRHSVPHERDRLVDALRRTKWNKTEAAKILKLSRMTVYRKISKYHLERMPGIDNTED